MSEWGDCRFHSLPIEVWGCLKTNLHVSPSQIRNLQSDEAEYELCRLSKEIFILLLRIQGDGLVRSLRGRISARHRSVPVEHKRRHLMTTAHASIFGIVHLIGRTLGTLSQSEWHLCERLVIGSPVAWLAGTDDCERLRESPECLGL